MVCLPDGGQIYCLSLTKKVFVFWTKSNTDNNLLPIFYKYHKVMPLATSKLMKIKWGTLWNSYIIIRLNNWTKILGTINDFLHRLHSRHSYTYSAFHWFSGAKKHGVGCYGCRYRLANCQHSGLPEDYLANRLTNLWSDCCNGSDMPA